MAKQSADMSESKFRKATEEHLKERDSLRASLDKVSYDILEFSRVRSENLFFFLV